MNGPPNSNIENKELPFGFRKRPVDGQKQQESWDAVEAAISLQATVAPVRPFSLARALLLAASLVLVALGVWHVERRTVRPPLAELRTGYGEVKHVILPDSSEVILNANSSIRMQQQWTDEDGRQIWLEGEAYFQVRKKTSTLQKFVVHTKQVDVEVLGTKFNVNTRREHSVISLEEGKVRLSVHGETESVLEQGAPMIMRPGQVVVIGESPKVRIDNDKDVVTHSGWSRNEFHFDNTSLADIARLIEDNYGYKMEVNDTTLLQLTISGDLRAANMQELVKVLEAVLRLKMRIGNRVLYVREG
jgi:transmembrane sensor